MMNSCTLDTYMDILYLFKSIVFSDMKKVRTFVWALIRLTLFNGFA